MAGSNLDGVHLSPNSIGPPYYRSTRPRAAAYTLRMEQPDPAAVAGAAREPDEDDSLIRWMLSLSPAGRLQVLQGFVDSVSELGLEQSAPIQRRP